MELLSMETQRLMRHAALGPTDMVCYYLEK